MVLSKSNNKSTTNDNRNTLHIICICLIIVFIIGVYVASRNNKINKDKFNIINNIQPYFNMDIYSVPGSKADPYMLYGSGYLPYESNIPAVDVLRSNTIPAYYKQYIKKNTNPLSSRD